MTRPDDFMTPGGYVYWPRDPENETKTVMWATVLVNVGTMVLVVGVVVGLLALIFGVLS